MKTQKNLLSGIKRKIKLLELDSISEYQLSQIEKQIDEITRTINAEDELIKLENRLTLSIIATEKLERLNRIHSSGWKLLKGGAK